MATREPESEEQDSDAVDGSAAAPPVRAQAPRPHWFRFTSVAWLRALREIAIVTLGILVAFALNAWWEEHRERRQEQQHLRALASNFRENIEQLARLATMEDRIAQSSLKVLEAARAPNAPSDESIRTHMGEVFNSRRFEPVMGAYEALVNSAGLTLVRDDILRASLADFAAKVAGRYGELYADELYLQFTREFMGRLRFADDLYPASSKPPSYADLLKDPRFQEYLALPGHMERQMAHRYRELSKQAEDILRRIERELR